MGLVQDTISGFIGGVSQQPDKLTYPNQARSLINMYPDVVSGLSKRKPTEHIAKMSEPLEVAPLVYTVAKEYEKYQVMLDGTSIRVFNLDGDEQEVKVQGSPAYEGGYTLHTNFTALLTVRVPSTYTRSYNSGTTKSPAWKYEYTCPVIGSFWSSRPLTSKTAIKDAVLYRDDTFKTQYVKRRYSSEEIVIEVEATTVLLENTTEYYIYKKPEDYTAGAVIDLRDRVLYKNRDKKKIGTAYYWALTDDGGLVTSHDREENIITIGAEDSPLKYIKSARPLKELTMANIGDYTFVVNKTVNTSLSEETYPNRYPHSALVFVEQGDYSITYSVTVNNVTAEYTTSSSSKKDISTSNIAAKLVTALSSKLDATKWGITRKNSSVLIENIVGEPFTIITNDGNGDRSLHCFYKQSESFTDLPLVAPDGFILKITGESGDTSDDYYVQFRTVDGSLFGRGTWRECCSPDIPYHILPETMPHALIHKKDGSFVFQSLRWADRQAGDEDTAKTPEFLGNPIQELFTYKGRLALLSGDKTVYSDTENIFSFFKRTTITKLDTDPIETISNSKMVDLKHALPYNNDLLLFSPTSIFTVSSGDVFSNSTIAMDLTWEYPCSSLCKPIATGDTCLFVYENGGYTGVYEIYTTSNSYAGVRSITEHVSNYVPRNLVKLAAQPQNNIVCGLSEKERNVLYVYNYFNSDGNKVQSAWHKWKFDGLILGMDFIEHNLYLNIQYDDGVYLEKIDISNYQHEQEVDFLFHLDRKFELYNVEGEDNVLLTYDELSKTTTFEVPYPIKEEKNFMVVDNRGFPLIIKGFDKASGLMSVAGNPVSVTCGFRYYSEWQPTRIYLRQATQNGGTKLVEGLLILGDITLNYIDSGYFKVTTKPKYTSISPAEYEFTGVVLGTKSALLGALATHTDGFLIPVGARNEDVDIIISNDSYLPCCFTSMVWLGEFNVRGK